MLKIKRKVEIHNMLYSVETEVAFVLPVIMLDFRHGHRISFMSSKPLKHFVVTQSSRFRLRAFLSAEAIVLLRSESDPDEPSDEVGAARRAAVR